MFENIFVLLSFFQEDPSGLLATSSSLKSGKKELRPEHFFIGIFPFFGFLIRIEKGSFFTI